MFTSKPRKVTLTLLCYLALVLAIASVAQADVSSHQARDHVGLSRMLKKRAGLGLGDVLNPGGTSGAASDPPKLDDPSDPAASASSAASTPAASDTAKVDSSSSPSPSASLSSSSAPASAASASPSASASASVSASSAASSGSSSSASVPSSSSSSSSSNTPSQPTPTPSPEEPAPSPATDATDDSSTNAPAHSPSRVTIAITATDGSQPTEAPAQAVGASSQSFPKSALTAIIVIASCIGAVAIGWTVIRKWKFRKSSNFDDRMAPIDWQPSNAADDGIPGLRRNVSSTSHGSFHSSGHEDHFSAHGVSAYSESASVYNGAGTTQLQPIPDHDFTAGSTTLAPVGGYADLARGPSPQPQMTELARGPSTNRGYEPYGSVPLHHQGAYGTGY